MSNDISDHIARKLNLEAEVCPYTLVKSRIALEELDAGQILEIVLGNSESAANVPRTLDVEGHEVLAVDRTGPGNWTVQVRRADG